MQIDIEAGEIAVIGSESGIKVVYEEGSVTEETLTTAQKIMLGTALIISSDPNAIQMSVARIEKHLAETGTLP